MPSRDDLTCVRHRWAALISVLIASGGLACDGGGGASLPPSGTADAGRTNGPPSAPPADAGSVVSRDAADSGGTIGTGGSQGTGGLQGTGGSGSGTGGSGPPSGVTINIGGVNVAKEDVIAFVHFGHSNMAGQGVGPPATRPFFFGAPDPHAWMYHAGAGFAPAVEPKTAGDGGNRVNGMVSGGPGTALVKEAAALAPGKYFVSIGFGKSGAYCSQFLPGAQYYNQVITGAKELKGKVTFAAIVVLLGITERHGTPADIANYPQCINRLVTAVRTDLGEPNLPLLINDYEMGATGPNSPQSAFAMAIRPKILMVPGVVSNSALIPTDNPIVEIENDMNTTDEHHFSLDGHKEYVRRVLQTMKAKGWFPW